MVLNNLNYPLDFKFKISTLASDFNITDKNGNYVAYVRQKMFKLKEDEDRCWMVTRTIEENTEFEEGQPIHFVSLIVSRN